MQVNEGMVCDWYVSPDFLITALRQIDDRGSNVVCVVEDKSGTVKNGFVIYYKNRPAAQAARREP